MFPNSRQTIIKWLTVVWTRTEQCSCLECQLTSLKRQIPTTQQSLVAGTAGVPATSDVTSAPLTLQQGSWSNSCPCRSLPFLAPVPCLPARYAVYLHAVMLVTCWYADGWAHFMLRGTLMGTFYVKSHSDGHILS